ncbi:DNA gyrase subunit A [Candidatus Kryptonium thompsonii]|uniref:DNA gyrase subunit A n=2 Tax=Candidatus Kryptonium thompsonii TaxID=1633631 RepID=A0A0P1M011_9BACT|nr:DNA gyrase subunit A [Candidatus Kryptonium thompsoni]CUS79116.1 DNA gyrase subunit A [Candidatus Kryptonium thompsoni]CUS80756.1 DNA gyrase subunit A [Candidatus Kryptonium thompsoni]CUS85878.1 DNA gyrase subunit A [Candidatus Kryptonium thompsoni]CUS87742.1 DNA gyrase subunit A [Candidatus Kryptonium thompsoni]CUU03784.1 DNA gyrase subunit A [Candidatus Kryptonium thompsoni]
MATLQEKIQPVEIEEEIKYSYLDYAMSVIVSRALPDVRDGLKPVQRRVLYTMYELGLLHNRPYKKCARIVGEALGKYHPHGDAAVYDTLVRLAQDFTMRYPLVDGQGNFGSIDGDSPAAMRYTEARLSEIAEEMLQDIEKNTVNFRPNFDETLKEPEVLPTVLPNLLVNGSSGIAVGMATNIPPHNLNEIVDGLIALLKDPNLPVEKLMKYVKGPDFPTGGVIVGFSGIKEAYTTGRGRIVVRAKASIENYKGRSRIVITEIPYQVNKSSLIEKIAELVQNKKIEDISDIRDESDKDGMRIVIELRRDAQPEVVLNNLYKHTNLQSTFGVIMLALVNGVPKILNLKDMMMEFINFRLDVIVRRTKFELEDAERRAHILEGYKIALDNIDEIVELIKKSKDPDTAKVNLMKRFKLTEIQAKAILDMRLQRLTGLERSKVESEYKETIKLIERLKSILRSKELQKELIKEELLKLKEKYGDERRTQIVEGEEDFNIEDLIAEEDVVITITHNGFIKRYPVSGYRRQNRGGRGITATATSEDDFVEHVFVSSTHHYIIFFTDKGRAYWLKVHEIPEGSRASRGRSISHLINKEPDEKITAFVTVKEFNENLFVTMVTKMGLVKKVALSEFSNPRKIGIIAINLNRGDRLVDARLTDGTQDLIIGTRKGMAIRFNEKDIRPMGRQATGVRGVKLEKGDEVIGMVTVKRPGTTILVVTEKGFGKRSDLNDYRVTHRGGKGIIAVKVNEKTGDMVAIKEVLDNDDIMVVTAKGYLIRYHVKDIRVMSRQAQGVKLIKLNHGDTIASVASVVSEED